MRRFLRIRSAVFALAVICLYLLIAVFVGFGVLDREEVFRRVGAKHVPGLTGEKPAEQRLEDCYAVLDQIESALASRDPGRALQRFRYGNVTIAPRSREEFVDRLDRGWAIYDRLAEMESLEGTEARQDLERLEQITDEFFQQPSGWAGVARKVEMSLGTDTQGRSIAYRAIYSIKVALQIGTVTALIAVVVGSLLGTMAAYFGGWVDHVITWLFTTLSSIPSILLLVLLAYMFAGTEYDDTLIPVYVSLSATFWIGPCRVMRGETLKIKQLEYVEAATVAGFGPARILLRHVMPNAVHLMLINFSLLFVAAIKSEVILTYLNLGVKNQPSWGTMISESASEVVRGFFWQIGAATVLMFVLVLAFNVLSDALQDVFDPKHVSH